MPRGAKGTKPAMAKVEATRPVARKSRKNEGSRDHQLEKRLATALKREAEALDQQTATAEILRVISSSPTDVQPVFDTIARRARQLCGAEFCVVHRFDGQLLRFVAHDGLTPGGAEAFRRIQPTVPSRGSAVGRSILSGTVEHIPDVYADADYARGEIAAVITFRSILAVPILREGLAVGTIAVSRSQAGLFSDRQIKLVTTFAAQAVIAIENVRLFTELQEKNRALTEAHAQVTESLDQQTATAVSQDGHDVLAGGSGAAAVPW